MGAPNPTDLPRVDVLDVAEAILQRLGRLDTIKLQKLVYYSQAWHLVWLAAPLFDDPIEAWENGPVVRRLFKLKQGVFSIETLGREGQAVIPAPSLGVVHFVCSEYGRESGATLSLHTHEETPWVEAWAVGRNTVITPDAICSFFAETEGAMDSREYWLSSIYLSVQAAIAELRPVDGDRPYLDDAEFLATLR